ncbi:MAG: hypothetical protein NZM04_09665 [Methylacidiphilales bacterium]|nr:hypothetical protein [Candidatus Methylacidiphilales bacterium]
MLAAVRLCPARRPYPPPATLTYWHRSSPNARRTLLDLVAAEQVLGHWPN